MTVRDALQSASKKLIGRAPATFFDSTNAFEIQLADMANEVAADIAKYQDWQALIRTRTFDGDGITTEFAFPADYDRMMLTSRFQDDSSWAWSYEQVLNIDDFFTAQTMGFGTSRGVWTIYENKFHFYPAPQAGQQARFTYVSKFWASDAGTPKEQFTHDSDEFLLTDRLLMLGLVWRYRENKGLDASGAQEAFIKALDEYGGKDRGPFVMRNHGRSSLMGNTYPAWPHPLGGA